MRMLGELIGLVIAGAALSALGLTVSGHASPATLEALLETARRQPAILSWDDAQVRAAGPEELLVVDARPAGRFDAGHPAGALSMPFADRHGIVPQLPADRLPAIVLVVGDAERPAEARELARWLALLWGLDRVALFDGGWRGWRAAGLPEGAR